MNSASWLVLAWVWGFILLLSLFFGFFFFFFFVFFFLLLLLVLLLEGVSAFQSNKEGPAVLRKEKGHVWKHG